MHRSKIKHNINEAIRHPEVRVVGDGMESVVTDIRSAIKMAADRGLDLVEISPDAKPPVCKVIDYGKFLYELKQREKEREKNSAKNVLKEIRFGPNIDDHDFDFKVKHALNFLSEGATVRAVVFFRGRSIMYKEKGELVLFRLSQALEGKGKPMFMPKMEGKTMSMLFTPVKK